MWTHSCSMHVGSSSPTRDQTWAPCIGNIESYPLDHKGSPRMTFLNYMLLLSFFSLPLSCSLFEENWFFVLLSFFWYCWVSFGIVVESLSCVWLFSTPWAAARQASLSFAVSWSLLRFMSIKLVMLSNHLILCHPFLLLLSIFPSIRVFSNELALHRWPKYWSFRFKISPSNEYSRLISLRIDWFDLLAVSKSLLQHLNSKASILWWSAFFMVQLTSVHNYWKNHSFDYVDLCWQSDISAF